MVDKPQQLDILIVLLLEHPVLLGQLRGFLDASHVGVE